MRKRCRCRSKEIKDRKRPIRKSSLHERDYALGRATVNSESRWQERGVRVVPGIEVLTRMFLMSWSKVVI